jgi:hypothetical protein
MGSAALVADDGAGSLELELSRPGWVAAPLGVPGAPEKLFLLEVKKRDTNDSGSGAAPSSAPGTASPPIGAASLSRWPRPAYPPGHRLPTQLALFSSAACNAAMSGSFEGMSSAKTLSSSNGSSRRS